MIRESRGDRRFMAINLVLLTLLLILIAYPLYFVVIASVSDYVPLNAGKVIFLPKGFSLASYKYVIEYEAIWTGYSNTIKITLVGTLINILLTFTGAYALSKSDLPLMSPFMLLISFTMFFGGGLIPTYMVVSNLGLRNTIWAMILPGAISAYNLILVKSYYQKSIPGELIEAAEIDGADVMRTFVSIVVPLSKPILATMTLFYAVGHWNQFFDALIYLSDREKYPLQQVLREILLISSDATTNMQGNNMEAAAEGAAALAEMINRAETMKYAIIIVATLPILAVYPFLQKYFMKGMLVGSIKG